MCCVCVSVCVYVGGYAGVGGWKKRSLPNGLFKWIPTNPNALTPSTHQETDTNTTSHTDHTNPPTTSVSDSGPDVSQGGATGPSVFITEVQGIVAETSTATAGSEKPSEPANAAAGANANTANVPGGRNDDRYVPLLRAGQLMELVQCALEIRQAVKSAAAATAAGGAHVLSRSTSRAVPAGSINPAVSVSGHAVHTHSRAASIAPVASSIPALHTDPSLAQASMASVGGNLGLGAVSELISAINNLGLGLRPPQHALLYPGETVPEDGLAAMLGGVGAVTDQLTVAHFKDMRAQAKVRARIFLCYFASTLFMPSCM